MSRFSIHADGSKKPFSLRRAFLKGALYAAVGYASYDMYVPDAAKEKITDSMGSAAAAITGLTRDTSPRTVNIGDIKFTFENENQPAILGEKTKGVFFSRTNLMDEWYAMTGRHNLLMQNDNNRAAYRTWLSQLDPLKGKTIEEKAQGVDALVDQQIQYMLDSQVYGKNEYFASPMEILHNGKGDCDDFAILKYYALRYLGVPAENLFVTAVGSTGQNLDHATLLVNVREPGFLTGMWEKAKNGVFGSDIPTKIVILDNDGSETGRLIQEGSSNFKPYYAMNEQGFWGVPKNSQFGWN